MADLMCVERGNRRRSRKPAGEEKQIRWTGKAYFVQPGGPQKRRQGADRAGIKKSGGWATGMQKEVHQGRSGSSSIGSKHRLTEEARKAQKGGVRERTKHGKPSTRGKSRTGENMSILLGKGGWGGRQRKKQRDKFG